VALLRAPLPEVCEDPGDSWQVAVQFHSWALPHRLLPEEEELALRACRAVGADYAGVDLLRAEDGRLLVVEVNGIPGWSALQKTTDVDRSEVARPCWRARPDGMPRRAPKARGAARSPGG
jgi:hypothetical protein